MRRTGKVAIGYVVLALALTLLSHSTELWFREWLASAPRDADMSPLAVGLVALANAWRRWHWWITLLVAVALGAAGFLARPRTVGDGLDAQSGLRVPDGTTPPRIWPALLAGLLAFPCAGLGAMALFVGPASVAGLVSGRALPAHQSERLLALGSTPAGFILLALAVETLLVAMTWIAARLSSRPPHERLALRAPRLRWWAWPVLGVATMAVHGVGLVVVGVLVGRPPHAVLERFDVLIGARGAMAVAAVLAGSLAPGFAEELLFRGYVQTRFVERWGALVAIGLTSMLFAAAHGELFYAAFVLPAGLWLGWVAWFSRSVIPAMICHALNNAVLLSAAMLVSDADDAWLAWNVETAGWLVLSLVVLGASIAALVRNGRALDPAATPPPA